MTTEADLTVDLLARALRERNIELQKSTREAFSIYTEMLLDWNSTRFNLTRLVSPEEIALNHFLDSLAAVQIVKIPYKGTLIDIGTGAGFPGLALKIFRPDLKLVLVEATAKKLSFCRAVAERLKLEKVEFIHGRVEDPAVIKQIAGSGSVVTARAVAQMKILLGWASPLLASNGTFIAWKGSRVHDEMREALRTSKYLGLKMEVAEQILEAPGVLPVTHYYVVCRPER